MTKTLQKWFYIMLIPALAGLGGLWLLRTIRSVASGGSPGGGIWAPLLFVLSMASAVAAPILIRSLFAHRVRHRSRISAPEFLRFQRLQIVTVMATPYLALTAYALAVPRFYLAGIILATLYGLYYHFPSRQRVVFDQRIFRVR